MISSKYQTRLRTLLKDNLNISFNRAEALILLLMMVSPMYFCVKEDYIFASLPELTSVLYFSVLQKLSFS